VSLRNPVSSAANMAPMVGLRTSSFAPTSFHVKSETELRAAVNTISMALKKGQTPVVIGDCFPPPHTRALACAAFPCS
jgi:isopentenyl phosphate kinase